MPSASRSVAVALLVLAATLLAPAAALAAHTGHIDLQDGLTLAQQFGYTPDYRQHVVTFDSANVPTIRSRGANEDDTSFVHRLEDGVWVRHDLLAALRAAYPDFAGTVHAGGYGTDRVDWDVDGRAYTVLTIRLDDDGRVPQRPHGVGRRHADLAGRRAPVRRVHPADRPARLGQRHGRAPGRPAARGSAARGRLAAARPRGRASGPPSTSSGSSSRTGAAARCSCASRSR